MNLGLPKYGAPARSCKSFELTKASVRNEAFRRLAVSPPTVALPKRPSLMVWFAKLSHGSCWGPWRGFPWQWQTSFPYQLPKALEISVGEASWVPSDAISFEAARSFLLPLKTWYGWSIEKKSMKISCPLRCGDGSNLWCLVNPKIAGKWMFIPLKMIWILTHTHVAVRRERYLIQTGDPARRRRRALFDQRVKSWSCLE